MLRSADKNIGPYIKMHFSNVGISSLQFSSVKTKMFKAIVLFCLVALAVAKDASKCDAKHNINEDDWKVINADDSKPTEKILCYFKCVYEEDGTTNSDGVINADTLVESVHKWKPITDATKSSIKECVKSLGPIKTCSDVEPSYHCVQNALAKQK